MCFREGEDSHANGLLRGRYTIYYPFEKVRFMGIGPGLWMGQYVDQGMDDGRLELMKDNVADERYVGSHFASIPR